MLGCVILDRVEYFASNDFLYGHNLSKIEVMEVPSFESVTINDAIEFYEIKRYFDEGTRSKLWSDDEFVKYKEKSKELFKLTMRFFNQITDENIVDIYKSIEVSYYQEFWTLFNECKLFKIISSAIFEKLIYEKHFTPFDVYCYKDIVDSYGVVLKSYILKDFSCISVILHVYEQDYTNKKRLYLPSELTGHDICAYIESYINSDNSNPNDLESIVQMQYSKQYPITDIIRLRAKRKHDAVIEKLFETSAKIKNELIVSFSEQQEEVKKAENEGRKYTFSYSTSWLMDTLDYPSILQNFIYVFEFADIPQMRCLLVNKEVQMGVFERAFSSDSSRHYRCGTSFEFINAIAIMQMNAYYNFLKNHEIRLEDVLQWFFTEYLQEEFSCPAIRVKFPSAGSTYAEKCYSIITAFETILKQFSLYVENDEIDFELVQMSAGSVKFGDVPSLVDNKYVYGFGDKYKQITFILFSDQCMFKHLSRIHEQDKYYSCFADLLQNESVYLSDYRESEHVALAFLAEHDLVSISAEGLLSLKNKAKLIILKDIYINDYISKWNYPLETWSIIQQMIDNGILKTNSSLFSVPEVNYLNYLLNRAEYTNGLEIRNKYIHGIQQIIENEDEHYQNYIRLLIILVVLAIKINDDFCLQDKLGNL